MKRAVALIGLTGASLLVIACGPARRPEPRTPQPRAAERVETDIKVDMAANSLVRSPLRVEGFARGPWFFEGVFQVEILDGTGQEIAHAAALAQAPWTTTDLVPFQAELRFRRPPTDTGLLVLRNANPSGRPEHKKVLEIPVRFR